MQTPVATIGIRGNGKVVRHRSNRNIACGYGGIWDLTSGAFNGPVEPGQAYSCNGLSCAEVAGFGQRQETNQEAEKEEEEDEDKEEEEKEEEEEQVAEETEEEVAEDKRRKKTAETKEESS